MRSLPALTPDGAPFFSVSRMALSDFVALVQQVSELWQRDRDSVFRQAAEVSDLVIEKLKIPEEELAETIKSGASRIKNQIQWARLLLVKTGYLDSSQRGVWSLTEKGFKSDPNKMDLKDFYVRVEINNGANTSQDLYQPGVNDFTCL